MWRPLRTPLPYAIGGAIAATFYLEPVSTLDVDVFISMQPDAGSLLLSAAPLVDYLVARGCQVEGEYVMVGGWPVQFLPPPGPLVEEALDEAIAVEVDAVPTRVFSVEHLAAIALETGRAKDKARLLQFVEYGEMDSSRLHAILERHHLVERWERFRRQYLEEPS